MGAGLRDRRRSRARIDPVSIPARRILLGMLAVCAAAVSGCGGPAMHGLDDIQFRTVSGTDPTGDLPWIEDYPVHWRMTSTGGEGTAFIQPPCSGIQAPVKVTEDKVVIDTRRMSIEAQYCGPPVGDYDLWLHHLIERPLSYSWDGRTLILNNDRGSLTFEREE